MQTISCFQTFQLNIRILFGRFDFITDIHYDSIYAHSCQIVENFVILKYSFFISLLSSQDTGITVKSYPLTVDTSRAIKMKPESISSETDDDDSINALQSHHKQYDYMDSYRRRLISINDTDYRYKSLALGICAALMALLFIMAVFCATRRTNVKIIETQPINTPNHSNVLLNEVITVPS